MKLVQKTLLATAVAVAFSGAAFADVTLSGKVALEGQAVFNDGHVKDEKNIRARSDGLAFSINGDYDILGGEAKSGFAINVDMNKSTWFGGTPLTVDDAHVFFAKDGLGTLSFGRLGMPTDGIANDLWSNTQVAAGGFASDDVGLVGTGDRAVKYEYSQDGAYSLGLAIAGQNSKAPTNDATVGGEQLVSDIAGSVNVGPAVLKAGYQYNGGDKAGRVVLGVDASFGGVDVTTSFAGKQIKVGDKDKVLVDWLVGGQYKISDLITAKATLTWLNISDAREDKTTPMQVGVGADYTLAKNIVAFTAVGIDNSDIDGEEVQTSVGAGVTVKF